MDRTDDVASELESGHQSWVVVVRRADFQGAGLDHAHHLGQPGEGPAYRSARVPNSRFPNVSSKSATKPNSDHHWAVTVASALLWTRLMKPGSTSPKRSGSLFVIDGETRAMTSAIDLQAGLHDHQFGADIPGFVNEDGQLLRRPGRIHPGQ